MRKEIGSPKTFRGVIDTTFRDGSQSPLVAEQISRFSQAQRLVLFDALHAYGIRRFEFFSPIINPAEAMDFTEVRARVNSMPVDQRPLLLAHVRCNEGDIRSAIDAGFDGLNIYMGVGEHAQRTGHGKNLQQVTSLVRGTLDGLHASNPNLYLRYSAEDAFNTPRKNIYEVFDAAAKSVNTLGIPDTTGVAREPAIRSLVRSLRRRYPGIALEGHNHNDYGYSIANSVEMVLQGVDYISTSLWGLAERSGITSTTGLLFNLHHLDPAFTKDYLIRGSYDLNTKMGHILGLSVPSDEPVSLTNRTHVAGVHTKCSENYEQPALEQFGVTRADLLVGPLSGWHNIGYYLRELQFLDVTDEQVKAITAEFKNEAVAMNGRSDAETRLMKIANKYCFPHLPTYATGKTVYERAGTKL